MTDPPLSPPFTPPSTYSTFLLSSGSSGASDPPLSLRVIKSGLVVHAGSEDDAFIKHIDCSTPSPPFLPLSSVHPPSLSDPLASRLSHPSPLALALALPTLGHLSWTGRGAPGPAGPCQPLQSPLCGSQQTSVGSAKVY